MQFGLHDSSLNDYSLSIVSPFYIPFAPRKCVLFPSLLSAFYNILKRKYGQAVVFYPWLCACRIVIKLFGYLEAYREDGDRTL